MKNNVIEFMATVNLEADYMKIYGHRPDTTSSKYAKLLSIYIEEEYNKQLDRELEDADEWRRRVKSNYNNITKGYLIIRKMS